MAKSKAFWELLKLSSLGLEMGAAVIIGLLVGMWLDKKFSTEPWLMLLFLAFGFTAAGKAVARAIKKGVLEDENDAPAE